MKLPPLLLFVGALPLSAYNQADLDRALAGDKNLATADLSDADLSGVDLTSADLMAANLSGADLSLADLTGANLKDADISDSIFLTAELTAIRTGGHVTGPPASLPAGWTLNSAILMGPGVNLSNEVLTDLPLMDVNLSGADLTGSDVTYTRFTGANLQGTKFNLADMRFSVLGADLRNADLTGANLGGAYLWEADLRGAVLQLVRTYPPAPDSEDLPPDFLPDGWSYIGGMLFGAGVDMASADLQGFDLSGLDLSGSVFGQADLTGVDLDDANLTDVELDSAILDLSTCRNTLFDGVDLTDASALQADFTGANLVRSVLTDSDFTDTILAAIRSGEVTGLPDGLPSWRNVAGYLIGPGANLAGADLSNQDLSLAVLTGANLSGSNLAGANFSEADLTSANLHQANLYQADLGDANCSNANLINAYLFQADLTGADLTETVFSQITVLESANTALQDQVDSLEVDLADLNAQIPLIEAAAMALGVSAVLENPGDYDLYTPSSILDLRANGPMIQALEGVASILLPVEKSTDLVEWEPAGEMELEIPLDEDRKFLRVRFGNGEALPPPP